MPSQNNASGAKKAISARNIARAVEALAALDERRIAKRQRYSIEDPDASNDDADSAAPVLERFIETRGLDVVHTLTNFTLSELNTLWANIKTFVSKNWNVGGGRKCPVTGKDMLFMTLVTLKHAGTWDLIAATFEEKAATFGKRVTDFVRTLHQYLVRKYIDEQGLKWTMQQLVANGLQFQTHKSALYAVDVTFQQTTAPAVSFGEKKIFFSKKHGLYGHKVEVSVAPNGLAINVTKAYPGSVSDMEIFKENLPFHSTQLQKHHGEAHIEDVDPLKDKHPSQWVLLADKGYQGIHEYVRGLTPTKRPLHGQLTFEQVAANERLSSDRVIVENFFGRLKTLWGLVSNQYSWKKEEYNIFFQTCVALTNVHIRFNPLRNLDGEGYHQYKNRLISIGGKIKAKREASKAKYRQNRRARIQSALSRTVSGYASEDLDLGYDEGNEIFD
ncbi:hypothetical protein DYB32_007536 [Aphanomyces invadans]|uniref:DDE Tnp4 domain-containing protein n=1 Tax=Aphanomyces invadans TaxID=157072 RepID=A0A3R7A5F0_9STRA|nr:hypothetical protein DYB32_007536 [Aphanomyces invadans]